GIGIGSIAMIVVNKLCVGEDVLKNGMPLHKQCFLDEHSNVINLIYFTLLKKKFGEENIAIERSDLHRALFAGLDSNYFHFNKKVNSFKQTNEKVTVNFTDNTSISADYVIAADGIHSIF